MESTRIVSTYDAKAHLSQILSDIEVGGLEVIVTRHDRPVAKIVPWAGDGASRQPGRWKGRLTVPEGWDEFTAQDDLDWYGDGERPSA